MTNVHSKDLQNFENYQIPNSAKKKIKGGDGEGIIDDEIIIGKEDDNSNG